MPEAMHNAIVAWDAMDRRAAARQAFVFLDIAPGRSGIPPGSRHLARLLRDRGGVVPRVSWDVPDRLEAILTAVSFGDHFSLFLAEGDGTDPLEMRAIERAKRALAAARSRPARGRTETAG